MNGEEGDEDDDENEENNKNTQENCDNIEEEINGKETKGDDFEYYDPNESGVISWLSLFVFTGHRQKMKHRDYYSDMKHRDYYSGYYHPY